MCLGTAAGLYGCVKYDYFVDLRLDWRCSVFICLKCGKVVIIAWNSADIGT